MKFQFESPNTKRAVKSWINAALGLVLLVPGSVAFSDDATPRNANKNTPRGTAADALTLKAENGPWLILAMSFDGDDAKSRAETLATELRRDFGMQAFCLKKTFDFSLLQNGAGFDKNGNQKRMRYRDQKVVDGYAVLVGDFDSIDGANVTEMLTKIKRITPKCLAVEGETTGDPKNDSVSVSSYRKYIKNVLTKDKEADKSPAKPGPMYYAFATRNPLLPPEFYKAPELDKFVKKLNEQKGLSEYSLIDCPRKFTVRVVVFRGEDQTVSWGRTSSRSKEDEQVSQLDIAAERAALTCKALRRAGYEAYQFHDRTQSYVTVGSFDELGKVDQANRFVYDRGIQEITARFGATSKVTRSQFGTTPTPRLLLELVDQTMIPELTSAKGKELPNALAKFSVAFDIKPAPMSVPRMSVYSGSLLGQGSR